MRSILNKLPKLPIIGYYMLLVSFSYMLINMANHFYQNKGNDYMQINIGLLQKQLETLSNKDSYLDTSSTQEIKDYLEKRRIDPEKFDFPVAENDDFLDGFKLGAQISEEEKKRLIKQLENEISFLRDQIDQSKKDRFPKIAIIGLIIGFLAMLPSWVQTLGLFQKRE